MADVKSADVQRIAGLNKADGRLTLAAVLGWPDFDEDLQMQRSIHLDFLYDCLTHSAEKGFTWDKVAVIINFGHRFLDKLHGCERITDILQFYNYETPELLEVLGERDFKTFTSYIFQTILPHFKLLQYVFNVPRAEQIPNVVVKVDPPFDSSNLKDSKPLSIWEYEKQIEELEKKEQERVNERLKEKEAKVLKHETDAKLALEKVGKNSTSFNEESIKGIIEDVMAGMTMSTTETLKSEISRIQEDLEFKLEKTALPRPQALGPPPRFNNQSGPPASSRTSKSPKPGSLGTSTRSKKK